LASSRIKRTNSFSSYVAGINKDVKALQSQANVITGIADGVVTGANLASTTELITNSIQSGNFSEGLSGWKIDGTGVAEFSDVFVRGDINAYSGTIGYWNISSPGVERNIGTKKLFGTFIESENLGDSDIDDTTGVYVGLYRSYREPEVAVSGIYRKNDIAIVLASDHGYKTGDRVRIAVTGTTSYNTHTYVITNKELVSNYAYLTTNDAHGFRAGDSVTISGVDSTFNGTYTLVDVSDSIRNINKTLVFAKTASDVESTAVSSEDAQVFRSVSETGFSFSTGPAFITVIEADFASFKYENFGPNIDIEYATSFTGHALYHDENVAGLYLNDYSKALFDHGYFSNEGINYVSAKIYNVIHNPSFEYLDDSQSEVHSAAGWESDSSIGVAEVSVIQDYAAKSTYGISVSWGVGATTDKYVYGTANYSLIEPAIKYGRLLYLNFDIFSNPVGKELVPTAITLSEDVTSVIVTSVGHELKVGDYVYNWRSDQPTDGDVETGLEPGHLVEYLDTKAQKIEQKYRKIVKVTEVTTDTFTVAVFGRSPSTPPEAQSLPLTNQKIYKINVPEFDISDLKFKFDNGTFLSISDVIDDSTKASWASVPHTKKLTLSLDEIDANVYLYSGALTMASYMPNLSVIDATGTLKNQKSKEYFRVPYTIKISSAKLYQQYKDLDSAALEAKKSFKLAIPAWLKNTVGDLDTTSYMLDSVMLSSQNKFFYGGSKYGSQSWYDTASRPDTASVQAPKTWIDIDLEAQTSRINYVDDIRLSAPGFSGALLNYPGLANDATINPRVVLYGYSDDDATGTQLSSGQYQRGLLNYNLETPAPLKLKSLPLETALIMYESTLTSSTSLQDTYIQLTSATQWSSNDTGKVASTYASMIGLYSDELSSEITVSADSINFTNWNSWDMDEGNRNPLSVYFDGYAEFNTKVYTDFWEISTMTRTAPGESELTSVWTVTLTDPVSESSMSRADGGLVDIWATGIFGLSGIYTMSRVSNSFDQFTIETVNADIVGLEATDISSTGGYVDVFTDSHPQVLGSSSLSINDNSDKVATTSWVKNKVDALSSGGSAAYQHVFVDVATIAALPDSDYSNGTSGVGATLTRQAFGTYTIDGHEMAAGEVALIKDQVAGEQNGVYSVEIVGDESTKAQLRRLDSYNGSITGKITKGDLIYVGTSSETMAGRAFINDTSAASIEVGTTDISFGAFGGSGGGGAIYTADPSSPIEISESNVISMPSGFVYNTDTTAFAKLYAGSVTPAAAITGDIWIQVTA
jgi:hypothetical protein